MILDGGVSEAPMRCIAFDIRTQSRTCQPSKSSGIFNNAAVRLWRIVQSTVFFSVEGKTRTRTFASQCKEKWNLFTTTRYNRAVAKPYYQATNTRMQS